MVSIVVPVFNGADLVADLHHSLAPVLETIEGGAEMVFVDDGSRDGTLAALRQLQAGDERVRIVELAANFGQHAAFAAGFEHARGDQLVTMDVDLQCDPRDVPRLLAPLGNGYDLVSGVRLQRRDPLMRRLFSRILTWLVARMAGVRLRDVGCPYNAFTREVAIGLSSFGELRRFLKPLAVRVARRVTEVEVQHRPRHRGRPQSSYSATQLVRLFMDFFVNSLGDLFAWILILAGGLAGLGLVATGAAILAAIAGASSSWLPVLLASLTASAAILALFGLLGDYVQRIYRQTSGRPFYLVRWLHEPSDTTRAAGAVGAEGFGDRFTSAGRPLAGGDTT